MQIHPLRTTQIEFEKSIQDFYERHQRQFLRGVKKWPKQSIQKFANYIREHGLNIQYLMEPSDTVTSESQARVLLKFCTRERIINFFMTMVAGKTTFDFSDTDIDVILNELDPFHTGIIQINLIQRYYAEEIKFHQQVNLNRPQEVLQQIRAIAFPTKRIPLQQALAAADSSGDGYLDCNQFIDAFYRAGVKMTRDSLEFLFDVMSERFQNPNTVDDPNALNDESKYLNLIFFMGKLFSRHENREVHEVDLTLQLVKAALIYKGVDIGNIFAEDNADIDKKPAGKKGAVKGTAKVRKEVTNQEKKVDMMSHYTRFAQCIVKEEFCKRVEQINATNVTSDMIRRLANYLSLNQKNKSVIYLNTWLHHLKRVSTAFNIPMKEALPVICSKLLQNETVFRSLVDTVGLLKQKRDEEKFIDQADLRTVLKKFGVNFINQSMFINEFTKGVKVHIEDLITVMKACVQKFYGQPVGSLNQNQLETTGQRTSMAGVQDLEAVQNIDFFTQVGNKLRKVAKKELDLESLTRCFEEFDEAETGSIKSYHLVNVLHRKMPNLFTESEMIGLQYELESLSYDGTVDYHEFVRLFIGDKKKASKKSKDKDEKLKLDVKKSAYSMQDYEDVLGRISVHSKQQGLDLEHIFGIFAKKSGFINYSEFKKILELISFEISEKDFNLITMYADENKQGTIFVHDFVQQIIYAEVIAPQFEVYKWIIASRELEGRTHLIDSCQDQISQISNEIDIRFGGEDQKHHSKVITGEQFQEIIRTRIPEMSEHDIDMLTLFAVKGSRRKSQPGELNDKSVNLSSDLIQFKHFEQALPEVIQHMTKEEVERKQKNQEQLLSQGEVARMRSQLQASEEAQKKQQALLMNMDPARQQREQQLINLITNIFRTREVSFYDAFKTVYDSMAVKNFISISDFKKYVNTLNLPLNVQDQRILRRIADPEGLGRVDLHQFCKRFETLEIRQLRLNKVLDQVATAFFINNFDLKKAFIMFDRSGDGFINRQEFRLGLNSLDIGLSYDQIDDLMQSISNQPDGSISYDDFIMKLDANIRHRRNLLVEDVNEALFIKLASCFEYSGESLYDSLKRNDFEDVGTVLKEDLIRVLKRIGMSNIEPHLHILLSLAGASETDDRIDILNFSNKVTAEVNKILKNKKVIKDKFLRKIHSLLQTKGLSLFDFFMRMDTNKTHGLNKTELKTGMQALGINITRDEYDAFWKDIHQPKKRIQADKNKLSETVNDKLKTNQEEISFHDLINTFVSSGCIHLEKSTDKHDTLLSKYRQQLKKLNMTPEKAYKCYDERDLRFVFKNDFIDVSMAMGLDFSEEELRKIFEIICKHGTQNTASNDQQDQVNVKVKQTTGTRFDMGQFTGTVGQNKDEGWLYQAYIKIHSVVLQKSLTYKRLFTQWREKNSKTGAGRLNKQELALGLKRLKAGLTQDEISRLAEVQPYEGRDNAIGFQEFQDRVIQGASTLEQEQSFERMVLVDWIMQFNAQMERNNFPFEKIFSEFDSEQQGGITFQDFVNMNEFVGVSLAKKNLKKVFSIIDKDDSGKIVIEEVKAVSKLVMRADENDSDMLPISDDIMEQASEDLKGKDILIRQQINDIYEEIKSKLEQKNVTLEHVFFSQVHTEGKEVIENVLPMQNLTKNGVQNGLAKLQIIVSSAIAERIVKDVRFANQNKFEITYKDFIDFLTRRRINVAFLEKGFIDPILASTCTQIQTIKEQYEITYEDIFEIFCSDKETRPLSICKQDFVEAIQSMEIKAAVQDITELFNYIDGDMTNRITKNQFVHALSFITSKIGAGSMEQHMNKGIIQVKKNVSNIQLVFTIMRKIADGVQSQKLSIRQLSQAIDLNGTGYLTRTEFAHLCHNLVQDLPLDHIRLLTQFFDDKSTGRISTMEFLRVTHEILNQQIGGGVFAFLQVQPIIQKIINQLSIDCDRFFDQVADRNQEFLEEQEQLARKRRKKNRKKSHQLIKGVDIDEPEKTEDEGQVMKNGLSKSIFFSQLLKHGVLLNEHEKALITTVFGKKNQDKGELDYAQLDNAFEGVQQQLYAQEVQYTSQWERRIFKRIGNYLMQNNKSISECFDLIDTDQSQTISFEELKLALNRFQLSLSDKHLKVFVNRLGDQKKSFMTKREFLTRFWAAYTYEEIEDEPKQGNAKDHAKGEDIYSVPAITMSVSHNIVQANKKIQSELEMKIKQCKVFRSIQKEIRSKMPVQIAFTHMDTSNHGFLTLHDFHQSFARLFCAINNDDIRALFNEIDSDGNGIIKYEEFETFYNENYVKKLGNIEKERQMKNTQNEIFDHLIKVLLQRGLTLQDCFDQIDEDKNGYIEVEEFHDMLERMGFTISQQQVYEIILGMDENFDGKLSYHELKQHINKLGFDIDSLEDRVDKGPQRHKDDDAVEHAWRDKALELVIRSIRAKVGKNNSIFEYFKKYDDDHDFHLNPQQFRKALQDLNEPQLKNNQIERILHIILEKKKATPLVDITRLNNMLTTYNYISTNGGTGSVLIDEDLFVYIVERFDGLSRMRELSDGIKDRSGYLSRHIYELNMRGLHMLSNQQTVKRLCKKTHELNRLYESTSILLASEVTRLIKEEGQMCVLDPTFNVDTIVNDENFGVLKSISLPTIEQAQFDIDYSTMVTLPCGAAQYEGLMLHTKQAVEITVYPNEVLQYTSLDGKSMKTHLGLELQVLRYLMGARFEEEDEFTPEEEEAMDVFMNFGKFEKRIGLSMHDEKEIYVVNKQIDEDEWINLEDFVSRNGGILNIPLFYHTDAPLFIIRHWAKIILKIIDKVNDVAIVLRCLNLKQLWISRDGQRIRLGHCRGAGLINNMGFIQQCPDIYIHLENNEGNASEGKSSTFAPSKGGGGAFSSSRKTDSGRVFSNQSLDDPFVSPEMLFSKFQDHTAALDVWAFGMILFSVLFGRKPVSYYKVYRDWYRKSHGHDVEMSNLPFIPPSSKNFIYDPFSLDFDNPFDKVDYEQLLQSKGHGSKDFNSSYTDDSEEPDNGSFNFENFMKSIQTLSYSAMFTDGNSKKFTFKPITKQIEDNNNPNKQSVQVPGFPGQQVKNSTYREKTYLQLAKAVVLERKNELGLILDLISSCLDVDPKKRPTIQGMLNSPIFMLDKNELTNAVRFSKNVIIYRSPQSTVCIKITEPLRMICSDAIENPMSLFEREELILKLFAYTEDCIRHIMTLPIEEINDVLTEKEKRKGLMTSTLERAAKQRDTQTLRVSPNSPVAAQVIEDKVIDMLLFVTFRYMKHFKAYKAKRLAEIEMYAATLTAIEDANKKEGTRSVSGVSKSVRFGETSVLNSEGASTHMTVNKRELLMRQTERLQNHVLVRMSHLLKLMVYEMHSYCTPLSPYVGEVIRYIVKFFIGEENTFGSEIVLKKTSGVDNSLEDYLKDRTFFRRDAELNEKFVSDKCDKAWHMEQKNKSFLDKSNYWTNELHVEALKIFKDAITESGMGQSCYPVINDYIQNVTNSFEPNKIFSKQMNLLSLSFLIPMKYTAAYYNELIPLTESLSRLFNPDLENAGKKCSLAMIRSVFQTGNSDKIKACLDLRLPKHVIHFLQDSMSEIRRECLLIFLEISKGLQDEDFTIQTKHAVNIPQEYSKQGYHKTASDQHKAISMASQQEVLDNKRRGTQSKQKPQHEEGQTAIDQMCNYMKRTIALIEKNENEKYINFALDIPNLNFQASKRFLREMAVCFESPVFIAPLIRLLKTQHETFENKNTILDILKNLVCGNERVLISLNSPACDTYMTLLKMLMQNTKTTNARAQPGGLSAQMRSFLGLQDKTIDLFKYMFEQRRPSIIRDISCIGASSTLLREAGLTIPSFINLADIIGFTDDFESSYAVITPDKIHIDDWVSLIMDLRCWIKHFYSTSNVPELSRIKALQRCMNLLIKILKVVWKHYFSDQIQDNEDNDLAAFEKPDIQRKHKYMELIRATVMLFDWLCLNNKFIFLFNEECGRANLKFVIDTCNKILGQFRRPFGNANKMGPMEDITFNDKMNKQVQNKRRFEVFEMTEVGAILQNILYQLVKKNDNFLNQLLSEANFGFIFGEQLILEFDFIRHCIDNQIESMVLMDSYVKKNEIRLNTFEFLLRSHEHTLKDQFVKSNFCDRIFSDYIQDFREFNIQFSKIDIEFLAFRRSYPLRLESISLLNTALMLKKNSPQIYTEMLMYSRRHFLIRNEMNLLQTGSMTNKEATSLLLFAIILESNEEDLIYVMVQEGVTRIIKSHLKEFPSLNKRFPVLHQFISGATKSRF